MADKSPVTSSAYTVPFASLPTAFYIRGPRYSVQFDRIVRTENGKTANDDLSAQYPSLTGRRRRRAAATPA